MKKMLYIMGVEWNWIFQRPQVLALKLEKDYELTAVCPKQLVHAKHQNNKQPKILKQLVQIPFQEKNGMIAKVAGMWHRQILGNLSEYDIIWVGYPLFGRYIPEDYKGMVIYDCMDNFEALYPDRNEKNLRKVCEEELKLLKRADIVFASSLKLKEKLLSLCPQKEITLVRNGYSNISMAEPEQTSEKEEYTLGYIGTISEWFDNELVKKSLLQNSRIKYNLIGPIGNHKMLEHDKVVYSGVIEHKSLGEYVRHLDCLIMPFVVNEIILYVDPVKLYEYIAWGKCIIASWYPEIDRFQDYVYFYHNEQEYVDLTADLAKKGFPAKFTHKMQEKFLSENTWDARYYVIKDCIQQEN